MLRQITAAGLFLGTLSVFGYLVNYASNWPLSILFPCLGGLALVLGLAFRISIQ